MNEEEDVVSVVVGDVLILPGSIWIFSIGSHYVVSKLIFYSSKSE